MITATSNAEAHQRAVRCRPLAFYIGRLEAFHAVLGLVAPGQPRFGEVKLRVEDPPDHWEAALYAAYRRLGSALSRLTMEQREILRGATMDLSRNPPTHTIVPDPADPEYQLARSMAYRQIIAALDVRQVASSWLM